MSHLRLLDPAFGDKVPRSGRHCGSISRLSLELPKRAAAASASIVIQ